MPQPTPLKRILLDEGRRQSWLAERTGIDQATLSRIVNGLHPSEANAQKIAANLGRQIEDLWPDAEAKAA